MDLSDLPVIGKLAAFGGVLVDVVLNGGDFVISIAIGILTTVEMWVPFWSIFEQLSERLGWIPTGPVEQIYTGILALVAVFYLAKYGSKTISKLRSNQ